MSEKSAFELHLEKLKIEYQKQLPGKLEKIEQDWRSLQTQWQLELAVVLHRDVHSLIGTSGTFGFMELSKNARELEVILKPLENTNANFKLDETLVAEINAKLIQLKKMIP